MDNLSKTFGKLTIPLLLLLAISFSAAPAQAEYGGGTGEPNDPYLIYDANQMNAIGADSNDWDKHFILMADIDLSGITGTSFNTIGVYLGYNDPGNNPFTGVFDGSGHTISNFTYTSTDTDRIGLFGYVRWGAEIKNLENLGLINPNVDAGTGWYVGSLVGFLEGGIITNCYIEGGSVSGGWYVGGLVGSNYRGTITNCHATSSVTGTVRDVGGLVGENSGTITNCYSMGSISGSEDIGGLVGDNDGTVSDSFWDIETSGQTTSAGGTGKTTAEMQMASTFFVWACSGGSAWTIDEGNDYPRLWWENMPGKPITNPYGGGTGEPNDPYLIYTAEQLNTIGLIECIWDKHFKLMADIDLSSYTGTSFNIIGYWRDRDDNKPFTGVFDGSGHTISNFTYTSTDKDYIGLFGYVDSSGEIKDLGLISPHVDAGTGNWVGSLVGWLGYAGTITNCYVEGGSVTSTELAGSLAGDNAGTITNCYSQGNVSGNYNVGGLVGMNYGGTITDCYSTSSVSGTNSVGGLVGTNDGWFREAIITNSYSTGSVEGNTAVGGLVGYNDLSTITNCYSTASVMGITNVGGLVGYNSWGTISHCYSTASVSGDRCVGGLVGGNGRTVSNCYATGSVSGNNNVGGLVGINYRGGRVFASFWDIQTSGKTTSAGGTGLTTAAMQMASTFTDAGWDFNTPVWTIDEGVDYPRLWWETSPVLHAEPEVTLGTSNTITWDPVPGANDYYAECAEDANFTSILYNTGWITETSYEFTGLQLGQRYWYSVKARNTAGTETSWSNVESSLQVTLTDAVDMMLDPDTLKNEKMKNALLNKINAVQQMLDAGRYEEALNKLQNDILQKTNGCAETGEPDKNDWIITCEGQSVLYPLVIETIENVKGLMQ